jgi:Transglutaminase-like superfamily
VLYEVTGQVLLKRVKKIIFPISQVIEGFPDYIPMPFKCYERALTARAVLNVIKIKSTLYIGFNPNTDEKTENYTLG